MYGIYNVLLIKNDFKMVFTASLLYNLYYTAQEANTIEAKEHCLIMWNVLKEASTLDHIL